MTTHDRLPRRAARALSLVTVAAAIAACSTTGSNAPKPGVAGPSPEETPPSVAIAGGDCAIGFQRGRLRSSATVDAFQVTKHPVTVAQYRACVAKGGCSEPAMRTPACLGAQSRGVLDRATYSVAGGDALPVTCATVDQAAQYCAWIGGSLPTMEQWMLAARGPTIARYPWGNDEPTCDHRAVADGACAPYTPPGLSAAPNVIASFVVGAHPKGASPSGVEDVLLAPELLAISPSAFFTACSAPSPACLADGITAGAIDSVAPLPTRGVSDDARIPTSTFRCALPEVTR